MKPEKELLPVIREDAEIYVKIKHPTKKGKTLYITNRELYLLTSLSIKTKAKTDSTYSDFMLLLQAIELRNNIIKQ